MNKFVDSTGCEYHFKIINNDVLTIELVSKYLDKIDYEFGYNTHSCVLSNFQDTFGYLYVTDDSCKVCNKPYEFYKFISKMLIFL